MPSSKLAEVMGLTYVWSTMRSLCWSLVIMRSEFLSCIYRSCHCHGIRDLSDFRRPFSEVAYDLCRLLIEDKHLVLRNLTPLNGT